MRTVAKQTTAWRKKRRVVVEFMSNGRCGKTQKVGSCSWMENRNVQKLSVAVAHGLQIETMLLLSAAKELPCSNF